MKTRPCHCCDGAGIEPDHKDIGARMKLLRQEAGLTMADMARRLRVDQSLICRMEAGERSWTPERIRRYEETCL